MRVGFSIVAGAVASVVMCFGYVAAHADMVWATTMQWNFLSSEHRANFMLSSEAPVDGKTCADISIYACATPTDLEAIAAALQGQPDDFLVTTTIRVSDIRVQDPTGPGPSRDDFPPMIVRDLQVYFGNTEEPPMVEGEPPSRSNEIALNADVADVLGVGVGDLVVVEPRASSDAAPRITFEVTGLTHEMHTVPPFSTYAVNFGLRSPFAIVSPLAVPDLTAHSPTNGLARVMWSGDVDAVTAVVPDAEREEGYKLPQGIIYQGDRWLAAALSAAIAGLTAWGVAVRRRRVSWRAEVLGLTAPSAAAVALVTAAAWLHTQWVHAVAPHMMTLNPLAPPVPWTVTAIASGVAISAAGAAWRLTRLQHHEVVDVDELARVVVP